MTDDLEQRRKKNFSIRITHIKKHNEHVLSITHNGLQWATISLLPEEMMRLRNALTEHLRTEV